MNETITKSIRDLIKESIVKCTENQQLIFKRMYSYNDLDKDILEVVDLMPEEKLDTAFSQIERTLNK